MKTLVKIQNVKFDTCWCGTDINADITVKIVDEKTNKAIVDTRNIDLTSSWLVNNEDWIEEDFIKANENIDEVDWDDPKFEDYISDHQAEYEKWINDNISAIMVWGELFYDENESELFGAGLDWLAGWNEIMEDSMEIINDDLKEIINDLTVENEKKEMKRVGISKNFKSAVYEYKKGLYVLDGWDELNVVWKDDEGDYTGRKLRDYPDLDDVEKVLWDKIYDDNSKLTMFN